ncbi:MAG TPA: helix-turn-helix domain-containing protein [Ktedonobacteraceae bacterium]|nr:helix-turn-helix domain-containing protein [Ktedonobacteraceae bacterium]
MSSSLGRCVRKLRKQKGLTQKELADEAGLAERTIQWLESGKTKPQPANLRRLAEALGVDVAELQAAYQDDLASDTPQADAFSPDTNKTIPSPATQGDTTEPTAATHIERQPIGWHSLLEAFHRRRVVYLVIATAIFLLLLAVFVFMTTSWAKSSKVTISGTVLCTNNERVVGIWVSAVNGGSNFATWYKTNSNGSEAAFRYDLPDGGAYNVHVGCGGSRQDWDNTDYTENGSGTIMDHHVHFFICQDVPLVMGHGPCQLKR